MGTDWKKSRRISNLQKLYSVVSLTWLRLTVLTQIGYVP